MFKKCSKAAAVRNLHLKSIYCRLSISGSGQSAEFGTLICCDLQNFFRQFSAAFEKQGWLKIAYQTQPLAGLSECEMVPRCRAQIHAMREACSTDGHLHRSKARL
jgi:hypothetical protein